MNKPEQTPDTRLQIEKEMDALENTIEGLGMSIDVLTGRLAPILKGVPRIEQKREENPDLCSLALAISNKSDQLSRLAYKIQDVIEDLQI